MNEWHKPKPPLIRSTLRNAADGLSVNEIAIRTGINQDLVRRCLGKMPDAYIDRWYTQRAQPPVAIWCVVDVPENCPRPPLKREKRAANPPKAD